MIHSFILHEKNKLITDVSFDELKKMLKDKDKLIWVDLEQATAEENEILSTVFDFHPLAIEDCTNINHHPKIDNFEDYLFLVMHAVNFNSREEELSTLELNVFFGKNYVVTYHARPIRSVIQTKERCLKNPVPIMGKGSDFLVYTILDALADNFIPTLNALDHRIDEVEDEIFSDSSNVLNKIIDIRNDIINLRKVIRPQRNIISQLTRGTLPFIHKSNVIYFRDIYDLLHRISEQSDGYRDMISGVLDTHLSLTSNRMNQIVKTLTIVATIMMPLMLITGIYGMNFHYMPETNARWGYFLVLGVMVVISISLGFYMKKKKWF
ncbi:MAG: magnesium and cobalt transport protein CorA [Spirochaetes bacterium]|nr:MAG: magnesium and cobalt transport protein CorA [Spirochaetota bacterium]